MSQLTHPSVALPARIRSHRVALLAAVLALAATVAVVLVLSLGGESTAPVTNTPITHPDESGVAAAISGASSQSSPRPDESSVAASISGR